MPPSIAAVRRSEQPRRVSGRGSPASWVVPSPAHALGPGRGGLVLADAQTERRALPRWAAEGVFTAIIRSDDGGVRVAQAVLVDASPIGVGLRSTAAAEVGDHMELYGPGGRLPAYAGRVSRCAGDGERFRVGIRRDRWGRVALVK